MGNIYHKNLAPWKVLKSQLDTYPEQGHQRTGEKTQKDEQLFFVVAQLNVTFPPELGMQLY